MSTDDQKDQIVSDWVENSPELMDALSAATLKEGDQQSHREVAEMIAAARGRPTLGHDHAEGTGSSPRRQVRLPHELNQRLDSYAAEHHRSVSEVMREALEHYLSAA